MPKPYVEITQDGVGRLKRGIPDYPYGGLYTEGIATCIAIIILGDKYCTLIHDTGALSPERIAEEFKLAECTSCTVVYNPTFYPEGNATLRQRLAEDIHRFTSLAKTAVDYGKLARGGSSNFTTSVRESSAEGLVSVSLNGTIDVHNKPFECVEPREKNRRYRINMLNNDFLVKNETMAPDLQFDGVQLLDPPKVNKTFETMFVLARKRPSTGGLYSLITYVIKYDTKFKSLIKESDFERLQKMGKDVAELRMMWKGMKGLLEPDPQETKAKSPAKLLPASLEQSTGSIKPVNDDPASSSPEEKKSSQPG